MFILLVSSVSAIVEFPYDSAKRGTLGYPRWKIFMDEVDSNNLWAIIGDVDHHLYYSTNGGTSWGGGFDVRKGLNGCLVH